MLLSNVYNHLTMLYFKSTSVFQKNLVCQHALYGNRLFDLTKGFMQKEPSGTHSYFLFNTTIENSFDFKKKKDCVAFPSWLKTNSSKVESFKIHQEIKEFQPKKHNTRFASFVCKTILKKFYICCYDYGNVFF